MVVFDHDAIESLAINKAGCINIKMKKVGINTIELSYIIAPSHHTHPIWIYIAFSGRKGERTINDKGSSFKTQYDAFEAVLEHYNANKNTIPNPPSNKRIIRHVYR